MAFIKCEKGHFYNNTEYSSCPNCSGQNPIGHTIPLTDGANMGSTEYINSNASSEKCRPAEYEPTVGPDSVGDFGHTKTIDSHKNSEVLPVRGWLVVVEGEKIGYDMRIHTGKNYIGRRKTNDICIDFDDTISKEDACFIAYDDRSKSFYLNDGKSTNNIYVNDELLNISRKLNDFDVIEIGKTKLVFRSLCNDTFSY